MSIKSDRWITQQCSGSPLFDYVYSGEGKETVVAKDLPLVHFRFPEIIQELELLRVGETYLCDDATTAITKTSNGDMIVPFVNESVGTMVLENRNIKIPSFGLSSYGYDLRLGRNFKVMNGTKNARNVVIDPALDNQEDFFTEINDVDSIILLPHSFMLGVSMEKVTIPRNVLATCMGKSSVARLGLTCSITPIEPSWFGYITLEIKNETDHPIRLYAGQGIMQLLFNQSDENCLVSYADRNGKYQDQPAKPIAAIG